MNENKLSRAHLKQVIAPFVFGVSFSHTEGEVQVAPGFYIRFNGGLTLDDTCRIAADIGFKGYDLIGPAYWPTLRKYGLTPTMACLGAAGNPNRGIGAKEAHAELQASTCEALQQCGEFGVPNIVVMTGPRAGMAPEEGADNSVEFLNRVKAQAEDLNVTLCIEILNAKDHADYLFDHAKWGFEVVRRVNSPRVKILYDIYHAQVQDGDVVRTMRENIEWIGHIHTAGNPGRKQLDDEQELNYPYIAREIAALKFAGYVGHEYMPTADADAVECLKKAYAMFDLEIG